MLWSVIQTVVDAIRGAKFASVEAGYVETVNKAKSIGFTRFCATEDSV